MEKVVNRPNGDFSIEPRSVFGRMAVRIQESAKGLLDSGTRDFASVLATRPKRLTLAGNGIDKTTSRNS